MILKYFKPDFDIEWDEWSEITGFEEGKGTWASASLLWFLGQGFAVKHVSSFDYTVFAIEGADYLIQQYGSEVGSWQVAHSNLPLEMERAQQLVSSGILEHREPTQDDIKESLEAGCLVRCLLNSRVLNGKEGYFGHAVVVSGYDDTGFIIQDPGLPPLRDRKVAFDDFEKAWAYPNKEAKELDAIRLS